MDKPRKQISAKKNSILRKDSMYDEICKRYIVYVESSIHNRVHFFQIQIKYGKSFVITLPQV